MTPTEVVKLTRLVKAVCPAQQFDEYTADAWADMLADLRLIDCTEAVKVLGQRQTFISIAEIRSEVRRIRVDRIERMLPLTPPSNDMTPLEYKRWLQDARKAAADGTYEPPKLELKARDMTQFESTFRRVE